MRKGIKIKAGFLIISWMIIFAHTVIPHNHIDSPGGHAGFIHLSHHDSEGHECPRFRELCDDFSSCTISELLFQKFNTDENILLSDNRIIIDVSDHSGPLLVKIIQSLPPGISQNSIPFRAPPASC